MGKDVIIACDFPSKEACLEFLDKFPNDKQMFLKIGMELFYAAGPDLIREIKGRGHRVFLDLKLHDIPNTVESAMAVLAKLNVDMVNVHASGTKKMMEAALRGLERGCEGMNRERPILIAVTQLTSTDEERMRQDLLIDRNIQEVVEHYAAMTKEAGLDGVVCSPLESSAVHERLGKDFLTVTPGVRFKDDAKGDQARVMTPEEARKAGSDYIVMGRPITAAASPLNAYIRACEDFIDAN